MFCPRVCGEIDVENYFPDLPPRNVAFGDFSGKVRVWQKGAHGYAHFYQRNVFRSCLKIFARLRAKILQIRAKTGHFGVKMGITISSSRALSAARAERPRFSGLPGPESCRSPRGPKPERRERQIYLQGAGREGTPVRL